MNTDDRTKATALLIAERKLLKLGWKFSYEDVGKAARQILDGLEPKDTKP